MKDTPTDHAHHSSHKQERSPKVQSKTPSTTPHNTDESHSDPSFTRPNGAGEPSRPAAPAPQINMNGALGDRAQMERDRLARQAAKQSTPATTSADASTLAASGSRAYVPARLRSLADLSNSRSPTPPPASAQAPATALHPFHSSTPFLSDAGGQYFLDGEMRHTALTIGTPATERTFSPADMLGDVSI